jgi:GDP-L-fucose synthase
MRRVAAEGFKNVIVRTHFELDLCNQQAVFDFFEKERPDYVFLSAAKVGGILANQNYPADFIFTNLMIQTNVIHAAHLFKTQKLMFLGTSCIYPRLANQPMTEECLLTGALEPTNEAYAVAKIAGLKMCEAYNRQFKTNFISPMPTNVYGPGDNFDLNTAHALPAMIVKFHEAKINRRADVTIWGTGIPRREWMYVDDLADACLFLMRNYDDSSIINVGVGEDVTIKDLAETVRNVVGYSGNIVFDSSKPDGSPQKLLDVTQMTKLGWKAKWSLVDGIRETYRWYLEYFAVNQLCS